MKRIKGFYNKFLIIMFNLLVFTQTAYADRPTLKVAFENFNLEIKFLFSGISALALVTSVGVFVIHFIKLASAPSHPIKRREVMMNLVVSGVCTGLLGAVNLIVWIIFYTAN